MGRKPFCAAVTINAFALRAHSTLQIAFHSIDFIVLLPCVLL